MGLVWRRAGGNAPAVWTEEAAGSLPPGGTTGEVLTKESDADGDAGWEPGGGSVTPLGAAGVVNADAAVMVNHGTSISVPVIAASPPAWLDGSGNIIEAGLYLNGATVLQSVAPTSPGLWARVAGQFFGGTMVDLDSLGGVNASEALQEMLSVADADLPFATGVNCAVPADVTAVLSVQAFVWRLLT